MSLNYIQAEESYFSHLRMGTLHEENHLEVHTGKSSKNLI